MVKGKVGGFCFVERRLEGGSGFRGRGRLAKVFGRR